MAKFIIEGGRPLSGRIVPAGNKNEVLPAIMASILTDETVTLRRVPRIRDVETTLSILTLLGVQSEWAGDDTLTLNARGISNYKPDPALCNHIRASILLLGPLLSRFGKIEIPTPGGDVIGARRIDSHFEIVEALGGSIEFGNPIIGSIKKVIGADVYLDEPSVTATENLLLLAVRSEGTTRLYNAACEPHVVGLCKLLNKMGAKITGVGSNHLTIEGVSQLHGAEHTVGPDFMEIGSYLCLGAIADGSITIDRVDVADLRFVLKTFSRLGIHPKIDNDSFLIEGGRTIEMQNDIGDRVATIYSGPWPAFPTDLMSVSIVAATQAMGTKIFHEKMFEGRMFFTDKLLAMGANIVLCDPHRIVVTGPKQLYASKMSSPDVRAGMAMLMAALVAKGTSVIDNIYQIERGYFGVHEKLLSLGAAILREQ
ncbi:MAG: UDP-N-acetylglucosamine 1-carboxyvinyltransferase [Deltaproteobacteria bacterium]|nr:UDP-N-acetylglucosamine 1-carboxyvinyltransferase [Deltaproteobacteria bacterium]